ncbi:MAG TPA: TolC family protein [Terriglobia bacterium]|nr:TolC family protein [Terriglobia bacterium]
MTRRSRRAEAILAVVAVVFGSGIAATEGRAQAVSNVTSGSTAGASEAPATPTSSVSATSSPFLGSVPPGKATPGVLPLSVVDAIERGLRYNLGILLTEQSSRSARGERWEALSTLLPHLTTSTTGIDQEINLEALGFPPSLIKSFPGFPIIVGPFTTFDARAAVSAPVLNLSSLHQVHAAADDVRAAEYTYQDARNLVVLVVGNAYLLANSGQARVDSAQADVDTAQALYDQAVDRFHAGLSPQIDQLRAQVELKSRQEELLAAENAFATDKLNLARVIGLPGGQRFVLTSRNPYAPLEGITVKGALAEAYENRPDYKAAAAQVRAAEQSRRAIADERLPSVNFDANFGDIGLSVSNSHETFLVSGTLNIPVFQGGRIRGELIQADAQLKQAQDQLRNLNAQIDYDVRTAVLNLNTAAAQVRVAQSNVNLAQETLQQARDRFAAGVTDNIEVVQAQDALANAREAYISSLYQHNLAKVSLARAIGVAQQAVMRYLGGK